MKNFLAVVLFAVLASGLSAQEPVRYGDPYYWFLPYSDTATFISQSAVNCIFYVPDSNVSILGLAVTLRESYRNDTTLRYVVRLYERMDKDDQGFGFWMTDSLHSGNRGDIVRDFIYSASAPTPFSEKVEVDEFYFDSIHNVHDTIVMYVFCLHSGNSVAGGGLVCGAADQRMTHPAVLGNMLCDGFSLTSSSAEMDSCTYLMKYVGNWGGIFPIIGFRCDSVVRGLRSYASQGMVLWNDYPTERYQVAVGYGNKPVDSAFAVFTTTDTVVNLDTMPHGVTLGVWVRSMCRYTTSTYDTVVWGPWSNMAVVNMPVSGIDIVESGVDFVLSPNPAAGTVRLTCEEAVQKVEMLDVAGRRVLMRRGPLPADGLIDLRPFPSGIYTVHVTTPSGIGIQRLVVE